MSIIVQPALSLFYLNVCSVGMYFNEKKRTCKELDVNAGKDGGP